MTDEELRDLENARAGYKVAVDLSTTTATQNWARFNAALIVNGIITATLAQVLADKILLPWPWLLPSFGIVLCVLWAAILWRGVQYQDRYIDHAKRLEERLAPVVTTLVETGQFAEGKLNDKMRGLARLRNRYALVIIMAIFVLLYAGSFYPLLKGQPRPVTELRAERFVLVDTGGRTTGTLSITRQGHVLFAIEDREGRLLWTAP